MKKLQNNFTTPEQSKRLLELGVPADSADMKYWECHSFTDNDIPILLAQDVPYSKSNMEFNNLPCWSVGRLMEIFDMCCVKEQTSNEGWCSYRRLHRNQTYIGYVLYAFTINKMQGFLDFSKLED